MTHFTSQHLCFGGQAWIWLRLLGPPGGQALFRGGASARSRPDSSPGARCGFKAALAGAVHLEAFSRINQG